MFHLVCYGWAASFLIILGYEALYGRYMLGRRRKHLLVPQVILSVHETVGVLSGIFYYVTSAFIGAMAAIWIFAPADDHAQPVVGAGLILGMWLLAIFLQAMLNIVRRLTGVPRQPIVFFNRSAFLFTRRRKEEEAKREPDQAD